MLTRIEIRNFAIIDQVALELAPGLSILSGETGAGKSILIDALGLVLGDRASADTVRPGASRAEITAEFDISDQPAVIEWLEQQSLDEDGQCLLRRVVESGGRSRAFVNGRTATTQAVRELGEMLVDIHGQHEHQSLMRREAQRQLLDEFGKHHKLLEQVADNYRRRRELESELETLQAADRDQRLDLLRYQVNELEALDLQAGDIGDIEQEHRRQANAGRLLEQGQRILAMAWENDEASAHDLTTRAATETAELVELDEGFESARELFQSAAIQLQEGVDELRRHLDQLDLDPQRLLELEQRISVLHELARKHHTRPEELPECLETLRGELESLEQSEDRIRELEAQLKACEAAYAEQAEKLTIARQQTAGQLGKKVGAIMQTLGMPDSRLEVTLETDPARFSPTGCDHIEINVSMNPGQPPRALRKVASGGELSRISLAIQVVAANNNSIPCMIFDEVDSGVGGAVAEIVGQQLKRLAQERQVMCVTHLPQVAAFADHHYQVSKHSSGSDTVTRIQPLEQQQRVEELARMLGGVDITERTLAHAKEMMDKSG